MLYQGQETIGEAKSANGRSQACVSELVNNLIALRITCYLSHRTSIDMLVQTCLGT